MVWNPIFHQGATMLEGNAGPLSVWHQGNPFQPPLLLLHDAWQSRTVLQEAIDHLAHRYYVLCPDLRGHGDSCKPRDPAAYALDAFARDLDLVLSTSTFRFPPLVGIQGRLGVAIVAAYLECHSANPFAAIYHIPPQQPYSTDLLTSLTATDARSLYTAMERLVAQPMSPAYSPKLLFHAARQVPPEACATLITLVQEGLPAAFAGQGHQLPSWEALVALPLVYQPALTGGNDALVTC